MGGDTPIPLESELLLHKALRGRSTTEHQAMERKRESLGRMQCYGCLMFTIRMSIWAVRRNENDIVRPALRGLVMVNSEMDFRDLLGGLAIIEHCADRVGGDFIDEIDLLVPSLDRSVQPVVNGYLAREPKMRSLQVMGFQAINTDIGLSIVSRG
jgi:hypothetical protein